ncbi:MAG TPA: DUF2927 domain-containing protein [Chromatiales bacterium]|nr:DUF2927 domain-containing protein [Thiotrichales bacterium]HIP68743.1 DUF2927 domain-containing protein [Chromatiales bacterium]
MVKNSTTQYSWMTLNQIFRLSFIGLVFIFIHGCSTLAVQEQTLANPTHQYFLEIALGSEYGNRRARIKKWQKDIHIKVKGQPTQADLQTLKQVVEDLNALITPDIRLAENNTNMEIYFIPERQFSETEKHYKPKNLGFFWARWNPTTYAINRSRILISSTGITQQERSHLIREELTQSLGLMNDSSRYPDSIFYQPWSRVTNFSEIDKAIIKLLYQKDIEPGMNRSELIQLLQ